MDERPRADARITLGIPSRGQMASHTTRTLVEMALFDTQLGRGWLCHDKPQVWIIGASLITNSRNTLVEQFLQLPDEPEWLLFLDDDQVYPANLLEHLMTAVEQVEETTKQSCLTMSVPVWRFDGKQGTDVRTTHNVFDLNDERRMVPHEGVGPDQVLQVAAIGAGCLMVHRYALERIRQVSAASNLGHEHCWFRHIPYPVNEGEDIYFCRMLLMSGIPLWCTTTPGVLHHVKQVVIEREHERGVLCV